jgi:hypothetical protein
MERTIAPATITMIGLSRFITGVETKWRRIGTQFQKASERGL